MIIDHLDTVATVVIVYALDRFVITPWWRRRKAKRAAQ